ncbi:hypothetical protein V6N13_006242 [Hibiscus sabdariffa]|uniref:Uncharacterized protein n=1 Tax=Hibiscus sabdariffa TaxID=183260 RepID=A0ABR2ENJ1_9ROSI
MREAIACMKQRVNLIRSSFFSHTIKGKGKGTAILSFVFVTDSGCDDTKAGLTAATTLLGWTRTQVLAMTKMQLQYGKANHTFQRNLCPGL